MSTSYTILAIDLYYEWEKAEKSPGRRIFYWHNDSEIVALTELDNGNFDIEYMDGTVATIGRMTLIHSATVKLYSGEEE